MPPQLPLMAHNGHAGPASYCLLLGVKRTSESWFATSVHDPKLTSSTPYPTSAIDPERKWAMPQNRASVDARRQFLRHDADLLLCRATLAFRPADVFDDLLGRRFRFLGFPSQQHKHAGNCSLRIEVGKGGNKKPPSQSAHRLGQPNRGIAPYERVFFDRDPI